MSYRRKHIQPKIKSLRRRKKIIQRPFFWISLFIFTIIVTALYFVLFFPKIQVSYIEVSGNQRIESKEIKDLVLSNLNKKLLSIGFFNISSRSIIITDTKKIIKDILVKFPMVENIDIKKKFPDGVNLTIRERASFAVFCSDSKAIENPRLQNRDQNEKCFSIDKNGVIFEEIQNTSQDMILSQSDNKDVFIGESVIDKNIINIVSKVKDNLSNSFQINIKEVFVSNPLVFKTSENWKIYFDPTKDIDLQITKMNSLLDNEITITERKNLQYIYLQYEDRAYYK